jgi:hypothetical protein
MWPARSPGFPTPPGSRGVFDWHFALNTDDSTDPPGLPLPPGQTAPAEFYVGALWDGTVFRGLLSVGLDRDPEASGRNHFCATEKQIRPPIFHQRAGNLFNVSRFSVCAI